jgi:hypothetical protein
VHPPKIRGRLTAFSRFAHIRSVASGSVPLTFPSHQAVVLPLKLWRPRWFDGVALCAGAAAPDVSYGFDGFGITIRSHEPVAVVWWGLPVALVLAWLLRFAAPTVAAHLPDAGGLHLRDYAALRRNPHPWWITVTSALVGAASHLVADLLELNGGKYTELTMSLALIVAAYAAARRIGRDRLLIRWNGPPVDRPRRMVTYWGTAVVVTAAVLVTVPLLPGAPIRAVWGVRVIEAVALGQLAAAAAVSLSRSWKFSARKRALSFQDRGKGGRGGLGQGLRPTPPNASMSSGVSTASSGRHRGHGTTPGSTSSSPVK